MKVGCLVLLLALGSLVPCDRTTAESPWDARADNPGTPDAGSSSTIIGPLGGTLSFFGG